MAYLFRRAGLMVVAPRAETSLHKGGPTELCNVGRPGRAPLASYCQRIANESPEPNANKDRLQIHQVFQAFHVSEARS